MLDPRATVATPARLWGGTGVKALSDAFEQYATGTAGPAFDPQLLAAIRLFADQLLRSAGGDLEARLQCQIGAWLTLFATFNVSSRVGINAALRHQLGVRHGIAHGEATARHSPRWCAGPVPTALAARRWSTPPRASTHSTCPTCPGVDARTTRWPPASGRSSAPSACRATSEPPACPQPTSTHLAELVVGDFANRHRSTRVWTRAEVGDLLRAAT